jgi:S-layer protein (TIGR01567 family)
MVMKISIRGLAFAVLMLSVVIFSVEAFSISSTTPSGTDVSDTVGASRTFSITIDEPANFTWYLNGSLVQELNENLSSSYPNTSAALGYWNVTVYASTVSGNGTLTYTWWWTVTASSSSPTITGSNPSATFTSHVGTPVEFNVTVDQIANVTWKLDGAQVQLNESVPAGTQAKYTNSTASVGTYTVEANASNANGSAVKTWAWTVTNSPGPDPVSGLTVAGRGATWINWTWTNPGGSFNYTMVSINGSFQSNTSNNYFNYTQFSIGTLNTISLQTVDTSGTINSTAVSNQSYTLNTPSGSNKIIAPVSNLNVTFSQVNGDGNTSVTVSSTNTWGLHSFSKIGNYYNIDLSGATTTGNITVELGYDPTGVYNETGIRLYHWNSGTSVWDDVTTYLDTTNNKVRGNVTSLSPFVPGVPPGPGISNPSPTSPKQTIGTESVNFTATFNQTVNVYWYINGSLIFSNTSVTSSYYLNNTPGTGTWNITVVGSNSNGSVSNTWLWTVRSRTYETGNRVWDSSKDMNLTYTWNPMSFYAFYYDVDNNVGNESLKIQLGSKDDRNLEENTITYTTKPDNVSFKYKQWGSYNVIGFMAEKYFASYTSGSTGITSTPVSTIGSKQLHRILIDDDTKRAVYAGSTYTLNEGYVLKIKDVDVTGGKIVLVSLLKDGGEVDTTAVAAGNTYTYTKRIGAVSNVPIIAVHIDTVFSGREANAAFLKGIFQISEGFTSINTGNKYGIMEITGASDAGITMVNKASLSLSPGSLNDLMGDIKIVVADNSSVLRFAPTIKKSGTYEVRGTISQATDPATIDWNPLNFEGFYYDINEDVGSEKLTLTRTDRTVAEKALVYTTSPQPVSFKYKKFGTYKVIGFMANKYFAGYIGSTTGLSTTSISTIANKQLHKVLADDDTQRAVYAGSTLTLSEGYVLKVKDVDVTGGKIVLISLLKDGNEVDTTAVQAGNTYTYSKRVGTVNDLPVIAAHIETVFSGREANAAFIKGIFQISEAITPVTTSDQYGIMKVTEVSDNKIEMKNTGTVTLSQNSIIDVMGNIKFHVADSNDIRFYPYIMVNGDIAAANQLSISVPSNPSVKDTITIAVTAGSSPADGAAITFDDTSIGTTNSTGKLDYTLTRSGMHNITATKLGYEKAVKTIQVAEWVDNRLSIEIPAIIDQGIPVTIKVQSNGTAIAGASITLDNSVIGATDTKGILNYSFTVSGTHNLGASKDKYISVVREISIRMPFSEYKALDIDISPNVVFTNVQTFIKSNITNAGTKADTKQVELVVNSTVVDNRSVSLAPGEIKEVNFTYKEAQPGNYTVEILGQKGLLEVKKEPINYLLIGGIATVLGIIAIYLLTAKGMLGNLLGKFGKKGIEEVKSIEEVKK